MRRFRNPPLGVESLERKLSPSGVVAVTVVAEVFVPNTQAGVATQGTLIVSLTSGSALADPGSVPPDPSQPVDPTPVDPAVPPSGPGPLPTNDGGDPPADSKVLPSESGLPNVQ